MNGLEIERKFLIKMPDKNILANLDGVTIAEIEQTYTTKGIRLRKWKESGKTVYIKTEKKHISDLTRIETESEITKEEYEDLLSFADPERNTILKTRYRYPFCGKLIELDLFPFWKGQAFCEVELESEDEAFSLPDFIEVIREVTSEKEYRNHALSKKIPQEEKF